MFEGLIFGWRSALLLSALAPVLPLAWALATSLRNRLANRTLAALLLVLAGVATPWMIGFAGFYDRWRWLSYAPFSLTLALAPLLWLYAHALTTGRWPARGWLHLVPAGVQALVKVAGAAVPLGAAVGTLADLALAAGTLFYGARALALLRRYRAALAAQRSDDRRFAAHWLSRAIAAVLALLALALGYKLVGLFVPLGYEGNMGFHVAVAFFALYLGIEGWRHAALPFPHLPESATPTCDVAPAGRDWQSLGAQFAERTRAGGWAADPELTLAALARHLGTNTSYLSRALNEGLGESFSDFVNGLRSERVAAALAAGSEENLLDLALDAGFASKATFNRAFLSRYGVTPSAYRARLNA